MRSIPMNPMPKQKFVVLIAYEVEAVSREQVEEAWKERRTWTKDMPSHPDTVLVVQSDLASLVRTMNQPLMALEALQAVATGQAAAPEKRGKR